MRTRFGSTLFPLAVLALLAGFTFWMERINQEGSPAARGKERHEPDFWIDTLTLKRYDAQGLMQDLMTARRLEHNPDDDTALVIAPHMDAFRDHRSTATADRALVDREIRLVRLEGNVRLVRPGAGSEPETVITTEWLEVRPDDGQARSQAPVTVTRGSSVIRGAGGIELDNNAHTAVVLGPVTGTLERKRQ